MKETLEEVAERLYPVNNTGSMFMANRDELNNSLKQEGFIEGAKWQQERSYSEEEVYDLIHKRDVFWTRYKNTYSQDYISTKDWFEQFKK
jgi:hypothetical protein